MTNPFQQWAMPTYEEQIPQGQPAPEQPVAAPPPAPVVADENNPFSTMGPAPTDPGRVDTWNTTVRGKKIEFTVPHGATKAQVREAARAAGVPDPQNRSLQLGEVSAGRPLGEARSREENNYGSLGTSLHQGVDFIFPFVDELASGSVAAGRAILGDFNIRDNYMSNMRYLEDRAQNSAELYPDEALGGKMGAFLASLPVALQMKFLQGASLAGTSGRLGAFGAIFGGTNAYGTNPVDDRWNGVPEAAALSGAIGLGTPFAISGAAATARRLDQRLGISDSMRRGMNKIFRRGQTEDDLSTRAAADVMGARVPQKPADMRARADEFRAAGQDPTLVNVLDETGQGFVGAMARRPGPGRETAQRAYDARRLSAPERIDRNMAEVIAGTADDPAVAAQLRRPAKELLDELTEVRSKDIEAAITPIRGDKVPITPRMVEILDTADGRRAIARAMRTVTDKETLDAMKDLPGLIKQLNEINTVRQVGAHKVQIPEATRQKMTETILGGRGLTVDIADRLARKFDAMAKSADNDVRRALHGFAREIRDEAKTASPAYGKVMDDYAATSRRMNAIETGQDFMTPKTSDEFVARARKFSSESGSALTPEGATVATPSERQLGMVGARRAVQQQAGENISNAPGVARKIAVSPEQNARTAALFDPIDADRLERMMSITEKDIRDFRKIAPNTGSETAIRGKDDQMADAALGALARIKAGDAGGGIMQMLRAIGVRDKDAGRIVDMAIDPAQTDALIDLLERSYGRHTAEKLSRMLGLPAVNVESRTVAGSR